MNLLFFLIPVIVWLGFAKIRLGHKFTVKELAAQSVLSVFVLSALFLVSDMIVMEDTKIVNGEVTLKEPRKRSCPAGWVTAKDKHCTYYKTRSVKTGEMCSTDPKGSRTCTDVYQTEYKYTYPWERRYFVHSSVPETFEVNRVDAQGVTTPARFASVFVGEPVAVERRYANYIRASAGTLLRNDVSEPAEVPYPRVYDLYRADRVIYDGVREDPDFVRAWNDRMAEVNRDLSGLGVNAVIIVTQEPEGFDDRLARAWEAHNINDLVITIGVGEDPREVRWADVRSWFSNALTNVLVKDAVLARGVVDPEGISEDVLALTRDSFRLRDMSEFEYLKDDVPLPLVTIILALLTILVFTPLITYYFATRVDWR